ncbi:MAG: TIGR02391 family protein, partial [Verrucomicrobiales bacterium]|nr:TIGR02391 family protein [Verrucomicrobiales bacterium]
MKEKGESLLARRPISVANFETWSNSTFDYIKKTFGSRSDHLNSFCGPPKIHYGDPGESYLENDRAETIQHGLEVLSSLIEQLETEMALAAPQSPSPSTVNAVLWSLMHAKVVAAAKARFDAGHYADAVEAALKELNSSVKEMVKKKTGKELDGADLMYQAFSPKSPLIVLDDLSTESGRSIQQGYMEIFAGAMIGIRNPKAHHNLTITPERAIHHLFVASLLFHKLDERVAVGTPVARRPPHRSRRAVFPHRALQINSLSHV